jgi:hypothetical protein
MSYYHYTKGCHLPSIVRQGKISLLTGSDADANRIVLALDSLNISYGQYDYLKVNDGLVFGFDFRIEIIRDECPNFYLRMKKWNVIIRITAIYLKTKYK